MSVRSFDYIKLASFIWSAFCYLCDASDKAIGFMLAQRHGDQLRSIMFGGRVLTDIEHRYATIDKELLACYFALKRCEIYIY